MKLSEVTVQNVADHLRLEVDEYLPDDIVNLMNIAKIFISNYTGIPITSTDPAVKTIDSYEDFTIVMYVLCQDMHDNRSLYIDKSNLNKVVETIIGMHCVNLL